MKIYENRIILKLKSFKNLGLGIKITIAAVIAILVQAFGMILL
jgi:hypothetical protein